MDEKMFVVTGTALEDALMTARDELNDEWVNLHNEMEMLDRFNNDGQYSCNMDYLKFMAQERYGKDLCGLLVVDISMKILGIIMDVEKPINLNDSKQYKQYLADVYGAISNKLSPYVKKKAK